MPKTDPRTIARVDRTGERFADVDTAVDIGVDAEVDT